jgi:hypothetical protein
MQPAPPGVQGIEEPVRRRSSRRPAAGRRPARERETGIEVTDSRIFELLRSTGADLDREHSVEAYLYFSSEASARRVADRLAGAGFETYAEPSPPSRWVVEAARPLVPTPDAIAELGVSMRAAARSAGGQYDGWWAFELPEEESESPPLPA